MFSRTLVAGAITFGLCPWIAHFCLRTAFRASRPPGPVALALALGFGPILPAFALNLLLFTSPGRSGEWYIAFVCAALAVCLTTALAAGGRRTDRSHDEDTILPFVRPWYRFAIVTVPILVAIYFAAAYALSMLLLQSDFIEYFLDAQLIHQARDIRVYPFLNPASITAYYAPSTHPPALMNLFVWNFFLEGTSASTVLPRLIGPFYGLATAALLLGLAHWHRSSVTIFAPLLLLASPFFLYATGECPMDAVRIFFFTAAFAVLSMLEEGGREYLTLAAVCAGVALHIHSSCLLVIPFICAILLTRTASLRDRSVSIVQFLVVACLIGGWQYFANILMFGVPIQDSMPVWEVPALDFAGYRGLERLLFDIRTRLVFGVLRGFHEVSYFSSSYWLLAGVLLLRLVPLTRSWHTRPFVGVILLFYATAYASALLGVDLVIKNPRYINTIQPCLCYLLAAGVESIAQRVAGLVPDVSGFDTDRLRRPMAGCVGLVLVGYSMNQLGSATWSFPISYWWGSEWKLAETLSGADRAALISSRNSFHGDIYRFIDRETSRDAVFLIFESYRFTFYAQRPHIYDFSPKMIPFFGMKNRADALEFLRAQKIQYVYLPYYMTPTFYRSYAWELLADPTVAELLYQSGSSRIFKLRDARSVQIDAVGLLRPTVDPPPEDRVEFMRREYSVSMPATNTSTTTVFLKPGGQYGASLAVAGYGRVEVSLRHVIEAEGATVVDTSSWRMFELHARDRVERPIRFQFLTPTADRKLVAARTKTSAIVRFTASSEDRRFSISDLTISEIR